MTDNIISSRLEFKDFSVDGKPKANPYLNALDLPINNKSIFVIGDKDCKPGKLVSASKILALRGYRIYADPDICKMIQGAKPVEEKSDEYYRAAATSRIIYALDYIPDFLIVRDGQYVYNAVRKKAKSLEELLIKNQTNLKTDYYVKNFDGSDVHSTLKTASLFMKPERFVKSKPKSEKRKILIAANIDKEINAFDLLKRVAYAYRDDEITLLVDSKSIAEYKKELRRLNKSMRVLPKSGPFIRKEQDYEKIQFLGKEYQFLENPDDIYDFLPSYIFDYERRRTLNNEHFDIAINLLHGAFYWTWLLRNSCDEYIYVEGLGSLKFSVGNQAAHSRMLSHLEKVYFLREDMYAFALEACEGMPNNFDILPYYSGCEDDTEIKTVVVGGEDRLLLAFSDRGIFNSKSLFTTPYFDDKDANYAVINYRLSVDSNVDIIKRMPVEQKLFIIDPYGALLDNTLFAPDGNIFYIPSLKVFSVLLKRLGKCFVIGYNPEVEAEAKQTGKEVEHFD